MSGKGDDPRPLSISRQEYDRRWEAVFGKPTRAERLAEMRALLNIAVEGEITDDHAPGS